MDAPFNTPRHCRAVAPDFGRLLMGFAQQQAIDAGYEAIRLYTHETMTENITLYTRRGYVETHRAQEHGLRRADMTKRL
ncbi:GNAT family N-acetyltransferase [Pseudomonas antarctica]|uniref:GNAT family N-acetyltransferase n=1 Tax=Pseudomonas antarctica TaxID=219572 RepID=UPI00387B7113